MAWDDFDPDGAGEPGDMRYDYELSRYRMELDRKIIARMVEKAEPPACDDCGEHHEGYGECAVATDAGGSNGTS